ncbi:MAG: hypothetical protein DHS20C16_27770 [Phycisphaerae bacterium]|nr:MAG: hypothetical protein DHS20C16_27770 [Phycisphaerae bacterium]
MVTFILFLMLLYYSAVAIATAAYLAKSIIADKRLLMGNSDLSQVIGLSQMIGPLRICQYRDQSVDDRLSSMDRRMSSTEERSSSRFDELFANT